jgi:hypothetical protein
VNEEGGIAEKCKRRAETRDVINAAEEPRPVLWTLDRVTPVGANGEIWDNEANVRSREDSCMIDTTNQFHEGNERQQIDHILSLRIKVIIAYDGDVDPCR